MPVLTHTIHEAMSGDHERLEALYDQLLQAADAGVDQRSLRTLWSAFERNLRRHMEIEEKILFPALGPEHDEDTAERLTEHARIRTLLELLSVEVDLHLAKAPEVHELVDQLRSHAAREDATVYVAADHEIDGRAYEALVEDIESRLKAK